LVASKVFVATDVRHRAQHFGEGAATGSAECGLQDLSVLLLSTPVIASGALLQSLHQIVWKISDYELRHTDTWFCTR
jgi:hypothetical protein